MLHDVSLYIFTDLESIFGNFETSGMNSSTSRAATQLSTQGYLGAIDLSQKQEKPL